MVVVPGAVVVGLVDVVPVDDGLALPAAGPGTQGFATVADVPLGVELLLVLEPAVVVLEAVPLVLQGPDTVPVPLVPIPVDVVPTWLGVVVELWLGVAVDVVPDGVDVVPEGVLVCGVCDPVVGVDPVIEGFVVLTAPALPVVPVVPVAEGVLCVAEGDVCVADGAPLLAPPGAVVVEPALPVVWAVATPMASVSAKAVTIPVFIISSTQPGQQRPFGLVSCVLLLRCRIVCVRMA